MFIQFQAFDFIKICKYHSGLLSDNMFWIRYLAKALMNSSKFGAMYQLLRVSCIHQQN